MDGMRIRIDADDFKGCYQKIKSGPDGEVVLELVSKFHIRNGVGQPDGSRGEIIITRDELNDLLSYVMIKYGA